MVVGPIGPSGLRAAKLADEASAIENGPVTHRSQQVGEGTALDPVWKWNFVEYANVGMIISYAAPMYILLIVILHKKNYFLCVDQLFAIHDHRQSGDV